MKTEITKVESKAKKLGKKFLKIIGIFVAASVILMIGTWMGETGEKIQLKERSFTAYELYKEIEKLEKEKNNLSTEVESLQKDKKETVALIDTKEKTQKELDEVNAKLKDTQGALDKGLADGRKGIEAKLAESNKQLADKQKENEAKLLESNKKVEEAQGKVTALNSEVESKEAELDKIANVIQKKKEEPKQLNAGQYIIGSDVPEGRYQVTNIGDGTNFQVYGSDGYAVVNTILGDGIGSGDYVFFANEGDVIETQGKVKLIPVE